jgi:hypothetical protein
MSFKMWRPFRESEWRSLRWRLLGRRRFAHIRVVGDRIHLELAGRDVGVLPAADVTEVRVDLQKWPYDSDLSESTRNWFANQTMVWLAVRTAAGRRYVSGPASLTNEQLAALVVAWRELCPDATLTERWRSTPRPLTSYD